MKRTECPSACPSCNDGDGMDGGDCEFEADGIFRRFSCLKCEFRWVEQYKFEFWEKQQ